MAYKEILKYMWENQKKKLIEVTWYDMLMLVGRLGQVYGGLILIDWGAKMYDAGQSLPLITSDPKMLSLFIIVLLAVTFMTH